MEGFRHYTPRWPLTAYVEGFWSHGHYAQPHGRERVMPTGTMNLVFRCDGSERASVMLSGAHSALASLASREDLDWTDVALSSGYFDQAHFIHDFKEFSGVTPSHYLRERVSAHHVRVR